MKYRYTVVGVVLGLLTGIFFLSQPIGLLPETMPNGLRAVVAAIRSGTIPNDDSRMALLVQIPLLVGICTVVGGIVGFTIGKLVEAFTIGKEA